MTTTDANGIIRYQTTDPVSPLHTLLNLGMQSVSDAVTGIRSPAGSVTMFAGGTVPSGWLDCTGAAVSRTTYSALFSAIGTAYGVGDGSSTFNLPNMVGRVPVGQGTGYPTLGASGGAATQAYGLGGGSGGAAINWGASGRVSIARGGPAFTSNVLSASATAVPVAGDNTVQANGSLLTGYTSADNNMQPYTVLKYIIRA